MAGAPVAAPSPPSLVNARSSAHSHAPRRSAWPGRPDREASEREPRILALRTAPGVAPTARCLGDTRSAPPPPYSTRPWLRPNRIRPACSNRGATGPSPPASRERAARAVAGAGGWVGLGGRGQHSAWATRAENQAWRLCPADFGARAMAAAGGEKWGGDVTTCARRCRATKTHRFGVAGRRGRLARASPVVPSRGLQVAAKAAPEGGGSVWASPKAWHLRESGHSEILLAAGHGGRQAAGPCHSCPAD